MDLFALVNAQNRVKTVRTQSDLRFEQYLQQKLQQQGSENIFAVNPSDKKTNNVAQQVDNIFANTLEPKKEEESKFEAIA
jgi:hypothetical protein